MLADTVTRLGKLVDFESAAVLTLESEGQAWRQVLRTGTERRRATRAGPVPHSIRQQLLRGSAVVIEERDDERGPVLSRNSESALYQPLRAGNQTIACLALEHRYRHAFSSRDVGITETLSASLGLALDMLHRRNAPWGSAEAERARIARELHDRIGQDLVCLALDADRLSTLYPGSPDDELTVGGLRSDLRKMIAAVRDILADLRADVDMEQSLGMVLESAADRIRARSLMDIEVDATEVVRLPIRVEREFWRIAEEAMFNAEKHARNAAVEVRFHADADSAELVVSDRGPGFDVSDVDESRCFGLLGMRERALLIGARLEISSTPGCGTELRCRLDRRDPNLVPASAAFGDLATAPSRSPETLNQGTQPAPPTAVAGLVPSTGGRR
jgi:signal transduction histidine kinase